jgi:hypothetical protein
VLNHPLIQMKETTTELGEVKVYANCKLPQK